MAIYHFSVQAISRGKGQSAVASASYRSGEKLTDERTGEIKFYKRDVQPETMILSPDHAPKWVEDRQRLWNEVEKIESYKNSRLAREINVALPVELSHGQQKELIKSFAKEQFVDKGMVADIAIHRDDKNNPHAHIMLTVRPFKENGEWGNKKKKEYQFDKNGEKILDKKGKPKYKTIALTDWDKKETLENWRKEWSNYTNKMLEREGVNEKIDHRSHADRGLETLPTQHLGHVASAMEKEGKQSERGNYNREIKEYNQNVIDLQKYREEKQQLEQEKARKEQFSTPVELVYLDSAAKLIKGEPTLEKIEKRLEQLKHWDKRISKDFQAIQQNDKDFQEISKRFSSIKGSKNQIAERQKSLDSIGVTEKMKGLFNKEIKRKKEFEKTEIQRHQSSINADKEKLKPYQEKYGFNNKSEFESIYQQYQKDRPQLREQNKNNIRAWNSQHDVLNKSKSALENRFIREVASKYPNNPEMAYMDYKTAKLIDSQNKETGKIIPVQEFKHMEEQSNISHDFVSNHEQEKESSADILGGIIQGIEQAQQQMERHKQQNKRKQKQKYKQKGIGDIELG